MLSIGHRYAVILRTLRGYPSNATRLSLECYAVIPRTLRLTFLDNIFYLLPPTDLRNFANASSHFFIDDAIFSGWSASAALSSPRFRSSTKTSNPRRYQERASRQCCSCLSTGMLENDARAVCASAIVV